MTYTDGNRLWYVGVNVGEGHRKYVYSRATEAHENARVLTTKAMYKTEIT